MKRVLIIGNCGVGKTTFSRKLAQKLQLPLIHLDQHYWGPNWTAMPESEWQATVKKLVQKDSWIIEGNYRNSLFIRVPRADTIIFLDFPKWLALWRVFQRYFAGLGKTRPEIGGNNVEKIDFTFLKWVVTFPRTAIYAEIEKLGATHKLIVARSPQELAQLL